MAGGVVFAVAHLTPDIDPAQHKILSKHVFDIAVDLAYGINTLV